MKPLLIAAACTAALALTGCVTVIDASDGRYGWTGDDAHPFDQAEDACETLAGHDHGTTAFISCMAERGWTRTRS